MVRSKRPIPSDDDKRKAKRVRLYHPVHNEVIIVNNNDNDNDPTHPLGEDSDIELIEGPAPKKRKGKHRAKASSLSVSSQIASSAAGPSTRIIYDVDADDARSRALADDEKMARRLAMEWAAEPSPQPQGGPSSAPAHSGHLLSSQQLASRDSTPKTTPNHAELKAPTTIHDVPYIMLSNPHLQLEEIKQLLVSDHECSKCGEIMPSLCGQAIDSIVPDRLEEPRIPLHVHLQCPNPICRAVHCRGCLSLVSCLPKCQQGGNGPSICEAVKCCAQARAIALFEALSAFDRQYLVDKESAETRTKSSSKQAAKGHATVGPGGTGYSTGISDSYGFTDEDEDFEMFDEDEDSFFSDDYHSEFEPDMDFEETELDHSWIQALTFSSVKPGVSTIHSVKTGKGKAAQSHGLSQRSETQARATESSSDDLSEGDKSLIRVFGLLTDLLPAPYADEPTMYDLLPHPSLGALILVSYVPTVLAQLLRNDSVTDWIARNRVYHAILTLLKRMSDGELTIPVLVGHRPQFTSNKGLSGLMLGEGHFSWIRDEKGEVETTLPLLEHFKKLKRQAEAFLRSATTQFSDHGDGRLEEPALVEGLSLCADIVGAQDDIKRAMEAFHQIFADHEDDIRSTYKTLSSNESAGPSATTNPRKRTAKVYPRSSKGKGKAKEIAVQSSSFDVEKEYILACERLSFDYVSLASPSSSSSGLAYHGYHFASQLQQTENATRMPKNRIHFAKELAVMATSLPPGIWVRVDEVRNDAIKVIIAGPQGTPYAGGLFEFDCFIPLEYPNRPPVMHLRTTGKGTVRFNPNLYNCGKVCLSLLGTWSGSPEERWTSKSTLLQVLVSIQSMILNEAPYYNEPGLGKANLKAQASIKYNRDTSLQTLRWAMLDWFKDEHRDGIWKDVIVSHFCLHKERIRQQLSSWAKDDPRMKDYHATLRASRTQGMHLPAPPVPLTTPNMDLVAEFDEGMVRVGAWPS